MTRPPLSLPCSACSLESAIQMCRAWLGQTLVGQPVEYWPAAQRPEAPAAGTAPATAR
jgi:hypothetical protein